MRYMKILCLLLATTASAGLARGHGFSLSLSGNTLVGTSVDYPGNGNPNLFLGDFLPVGGQIRSDHGGAGTSFFGTGKSLSFDVLGPLWYSDGGLAMPVDSHLSLLIQSQYALGGPITIDGDSALTAGFPITGNDQHEFRFTLQGATFPADDGVYGIAYAVKGSPTAGAPFTPTHLLVTTWITPGFDPGSDPLDPNSPLQRAERAIYDAATAVPEPSTIVLAAAGFVVLVFVGLRRQRQRPELV